MILCTCERLINLLQTAAKDAEAFPQLRSLVYDYYWAEEEYRFVPVQLEAVFAVLAAYFESEAAFGDPARSQRLRIAAVALELECSPEAAVAGLRIDEVKQLQLGLMQHKVSEHVFWRRVKSLTPVAVDVRRVLELVELLVRGAGASHRSD